MSLTYEWRDYMVNDTPTPSLLVRRDDEIIWSYIPSVDGPLGTPYVLQLLQILEVKDLVSQGEDQP